MERPVPPPRKNSQSKIPVLNKSSDLSSANEEMASFVHVADVHSSNAVPVEKKRKKLRRRSTFTLKKEEDIRIYNSDEIDSSDSKSVKEKKPKRGSSTETLSEDSGSRVKIGPVTKHRKPHGSATETLSEESEEKPPVPLPRKSIPKSPENVPSPIHPTETIEAAPKTPEIAESPKSYCTTSSMDYKDTGVMPPPRHKRHKKRRKLKDSQDTNLDGSKPSEKDETTTVDTKPQKDETAVCITIHGSEPLKMKDFNSRPYLKVYALDTKASTYKRSAYGKMNVNVLQTLPFDCVYQKTVMPRWDEDLFWMEPISHIASSDTILIFEILSEKDELICWAFLKPVAVNGATNVGRRLRLQLYRPSKQTSKDSELPKAFYWWQSGKHVNYKSTLFITINAVPSDFVEKPKNKETSKNEKSEEKACLETNVHVDEEIKSVVWSRLPTLSCRLPNKIMKHLPAGPDGGMSICYSNSGLLLAAHTSHTITVFTYKGTRYLTLLGHQGLVYSLSWSHDDNYLLSSSADATACVWDVANKRSRAIRVFPHPSYVYSACWLDFSVATACYDFQIRLWNLNSDTPVQHLVYHKARVNTLAPLKPLDGSDEVLASGDSDGIIIFWKTNNSNLEISRELKIREIKGTIINHLIVHPAGKRMLVHTRDSLLRMIDITSGSIIQWFQGGINTKLQTSSTFCGCGSRVLGASEDGTLSVWDGHTGEKIAFYNKLFDLDCPASISFHPYDHMMAVISHSNQGFPTLTIGRFDRDDSVEIGLVWIEKSEQSQYSLSSSSQSVSDLRDTDASPPSRGRKKKKNGFLRTILGKKEKRGVANEGYHDTEAFLPLKPAYTSQNYGPDTDNRLSDIIKKMDKILVSVSNSSLE